MEELIPKKKGRKRRKRRIFVRLMIWLILVFAMIGMITVVALIVYGISKLVPKASSEKTVNTSGSYDLPGVSIDDPQTSAATSGGSGTAASSATASASAISVSSSDEHLNIDLQLLTKNPYSRPGTTLSNVNAVVIHYTASPKGTAAENREYFEDLRIFKTTKASSHFIVGLDGEVVQCIPTREIAYASNNRNKDTVAIECCHEDETGKFNEKTLDSMKKLTAWLLVKFGLSADDGIIRHYDVSGKLCPKYFVEHEDEWKKFKDSVAEYVDEHRAALAADDYLTFTEFGRT